MLALISTLVQCSSKDTSLLDEDSDKIKHLAWEPLSKIEFPAFLNKKSDTFKSSFAQMATVSSTWRPLISSDTLMTVKKMFIVAKKLRRWSSSRGWWKKRTLVSATQTNQRIKKNRARDFWNFVFPARARWRIKKQPPSLELGLGLLDFYDPITWSSIGLLLILRITSSNPVDLSNQLRLWLDMNNHYWALLVGKKFSGPFLLVPGLLWASTALSPPWFLGPSLRAWTQARSISSRHCSCFCAVT